MSVATISPATTTATTTAVSRRPYRPNWRASPPSYMLYPPNWGQADCTDVPFQWSPTPGNYSPPPPAFNVMCLRVPIKQIDPETMRFVVGKDGAVWKSISHECNVLYIWTDRAAGFVEVWGSFQSVWAAIDRIIARMDLIRSQQYPEL